MNEIDFYKCFSFNSYEFNNYHFWDNSKKPITQHYFGCLVSGSATIKAKKVQLKIAPNEIFYIPKGQKYQSEWFGEKIRFYSFGFKISPINKSFVLQKVNCSNKAKELLAELCKETDCSQKNIGKLFYFFELVAAEMKLSENMHVNQTIQKAIDCISENPNQRISDVAKFCNVSESGLYSLFKRHLNKTPNVVCNETLCNKAVVLLSTTDKSVQEISDSLGFSSTSYFRKILKTHKGKTPREIRKYPVF